MKSRNLIISAVAVAALLLGGAYAGSPFYAVHSLKQAAAAGDQDKLNELVDFPAVRDSLKSQIQTGITESLNNDPDMKDNPFAGFALMLIPSLVSSAVDVFVTPEGIAAMVQGEKPTDRAGPNPTPAPAEKPEAKAKYDYATLDTFKVSFTSGDTAPATFVLNRQGLFKWQLKRIELPDDLFKQSDATPAQPAD